MNMSLQAMFQYGVAPVRMFWKELLVQRLEETGGPVSKDTRDLAMLVTLIESAVTPD